MDVDEANGACADVLDALEGTVIARRSVLETVLIGILARGHILLEDVPGTGKTLTARSVAAALDLSFSRIQFTPDLLPTDVTGTHIFDEKERSFEFQKGPIFANVVLGDEINRAPPKTQAALLEAMEERQVTVGGDTFDLPEPFFVIATQNPVESEGSLHPAETVYMGGRLWEARDALRHAEEQGRLIHNGEQTRVYSVESSTQSIGLTGKVSEQEAFLYESDYDGRIFSITTKTGRETRVTGNHPFLVSRDGVVQWIEARNLHDDDILLVPDNLGSVDDEFPSHDETLSTLSEEFTVYRRESVDDAIAAIETREYTCEDVDVVRIARGLSKRQLAEKVSATYDRVLNYLDGADTSVGTELVDVLSAEELPTPADLVESFRIHRFERSPTDREAGFIVGFVLSDGHYTDSSIAIYQSNYPEKFERWVDIVRDLGLNVRIREIKGGREAKVDSKPFVEYLSHRYGLKSPSNVLSAPEEYRREFLEILLISESHFDREHRRLTFRQKDREMTNVIAHLLLQFGILPWIRDDERIYTIRIQGEDVRTYLETFEWPGDPPSVDDFKSSHRTMPIAMEDAKCIIESLGVDRDGGYSERDWYQSYRMNRSGNNSMMKSKVEAFVSDMEAELATREETDVRVQASERLGKAARNSGLAITDVIQGAGLSKHAVWKAYQGGTTPPEAIEFVSEIRRQRLDLARKKLGKLRSLLSSDVFFDRIETIRSESYQGTVIGLSVPDTHNYVAGFGACGFNHNTFPLPEAQIDRFAVKTSLGYPDQDGEVELLRRRAGRMTRSPTVEPILDGAAAVRDLRAVPETIHVDEDLLRYIAAVTRATRDDRHVKVGVSPRGTQRLFEASRARALLEGRDYVTPDDVKRAAQPVLAHRLVLTPDASVSDISKAEIIDTVLDKIAVPTVD